jgi:ATP-dependent helicase HrpB
MFPVEIRYTKRSDRRPLPEQVEEAVRTVLPATMENLLVFLPGVGEIFRCQSQLSSLASKQNIDLFPLYGDLPPEEQDRVLAPSSRRKIVLATNVAETSVTIDGIEAVIDSGQARVLMFDHGAGLDRLELAPISKASADQRI